MYLYNLTLSPASAITAAIYGNFSAPKVQEIVVARGKVLELLRPDDTGKVQVVHSTEVFGIVRSLQPFRFPGSQEDYVIAGSDSGRIVILKYSKEKHCFEKIHQETYGKTGCRRIVPGEYLAVDPKGRACMIAAVEKQKFVYILNRDSEARLTISSPLEAHKSQHIVFDIVGMDMGFDNPQFAAIELDYGEVDQDPSGDAAAEAEKQLVIYELDLGLNNVVRKYAERVDSGANMLIAVPGLADGGPGGVIVCCDNFLLYRNPDHPELRAVIPRRTDTPGDRGVLITAAATLKQKNKFYMFVQSEYGDMYRVTLSYEGDAVSELRIKYFDTIPPAISLCILRKGYLFAASEFGDHALYQFQGLGDDDGVESSSAELVELEEGYQPVFFEPRTPPANLDLFDRVESLCPVIDMKVAPLIEGEEVPQIYTACGRGSRSTLRVLRPGVAVTRVADSQLPKPATGIWTLRQATTDEHDSYIVVSFIDSTMVLRVGDTVEETTDSGLAGNISTHTVQLLADDSTLQVHASGLRHIRPDKRINEWRAPGRRKVVQAATNTRQVVIALEGGEVIYFELNPQGMLVETEKKDMGGDIACLDVAPLSEGRQRSKFLAVGFYDATIRVFSLEHGNTLSMLSTLAVGANPESVLLLDSPVLGKAGTEEGAGAGALFLQVGLNGVLMRAEVDRVTGQLTDTRSRFLGTKPPKLVRVTVREEPAMLALSSRPWLGYSDLGRFHLVPMSHEPLDHACAFSSEQVPEGFISISKGRLRVLTIDRLSQFNQQTLALRYTPRRMVVHPDHHTIIVAEADHQTVPLAERAQSDGAQAMETDQPTDTGATALAPDASGPEADPDTQAKEDQLGAPKGAQGQWASCIRIVSPASMTTSHVMELDNNEAALCLDVAAFESHPEYGKLLCVGTVKGLKFNPRECEAGYVRVYQLSEDGTKMQLLHVTEVGGIPRTIAAFKGKLLVGVGNCLKMFDLGKKRLLRKCEYRNLPSDIATLQVRGPRIYVGDAQNSFFFMKYKKLENAFYVFADDAVPRHITAAVDLDYDTVCGGDRFGNLSVLRLPGELSAAVEEDPTGGKFADQGAANKLESVAMFHVGETITALQRAAMQPGGREVLLYATINGAIGAIYPFNSREDVDFFQHLEMHLRQEAPPLLGRDHLAFRSFYFPCKDVLDGDLCEQYASLPMDKRQSIAADLDRTPGEVLKKLEDVRNKII